MDIDEVEAEFEDTDDKVVEAGPDHCLDLERVIIGVDRLRSDSKPESNPKVGTMASGDKKSFERNPWFNGVLVHRVR